MILRIEIWWGALRKGHHAAIRWNFGRLHKTYVQVDTYVQVVYKRNTQKRRIFAALHVLMDQNEWYICS